MKAVYPIKEFAKMVAFKNIGHSYFTFDGLDLGAYVHIYTKYEVSMTNTAARMMTTPKTMTMEKA